MAILNRIQSLEEKKLALESLIAEEMIRPQPDVIKIGKWKKEKLYTKDEIHILRRTAA